MKKLLLLFLLMAAPLWAQTTTPNLGLVKPAPIAGTWAEELNENFDKIDAKFPGGQGGHVIQDEGADLPAQPKINFIGSAVSCVNNAGANRTECTFTGGGGGGAPTTADYLVRTADGGLDAERVVTDTTCLVWDWSVAGQAKLNISNDCLGPTQINETANFAFSGQLIHSSTIATFPAAGTIGRFRIATDAASASTCASGGGSTKNVCFDNGTAWVVVGSLVEADTQQSTFDRGKRITGANSQGNAWLAGDGTREVGVYGDGADGAVIDCKISGVWGDCDKGWKLNANKKHQGKDSTGAIAVSYDSSQSTPNGKLGGIASAWRPVKSIAWDAGGLNVDGTNCTVPTEQALNSSEKTWAFSCADNNASIFGGKVRMPVAWDGDTVAFVLSLFHGTTETITFAGDFSAQCRGAGDTINSTYGTAVAADVAITTANQVAEATTAAVTPNGSCAGGKWLLWRYVVDAANFSANAANSKILGVTLRYSVSSLSD